MLRRGVERRRQVLRIDVAEMHKVKCERIWPEQVKQLRERFETSENHVESENSVAQCKSDE